MNNLILRVMHVLLTCSVLIGNLDASPFVDEIEVRSGWEELADDARVTIPKKLMEFGLIDIKSGQKVEINVGYELDGVSYNRDVFSGYVSKVNPKVPLEILCEDASWLFKRTNISKAWLKPVTLKEILTYVTNEVNANHADKQDVVITKEIPDITFDKFRIANRNGAQVLQTFKESPYNLAVYFDDHELQTHLAYSKNYGEVEYFLDNNVIDHDLEYREDGDFNVQIKSVILKADNTFEENTYGESGGELVTLTFNANSDPDIVKTLSETRLKKYAKGYRGSLKSFMVPYARHSMTARVVDPEFQRDEKYHIDSTHLKFGDGIDITVDLGINV